MDHARKPRQAVRRRLPFIARLIRPLAAGLLAVLPMPPATAEILNEAVATATYGPDAVRSAPSGQSVPLALSAPSIAVSIMPGSHGFAKPGDTVEFTITVTNTGNVTLDDLAIGDAGAASLTCPAGIAPTTVASGQSQTCRATHEATAADIAAGEMQATANVTANAPDGSPVQAPSATASISLLTLDIAVRMALVSGPFTPKENATVTYRIEAANAGPIDATNVVVTDRLAAGLAYVSDSGGGAYQPDSGQWTVGTLAAGAKAALDITARVENGTAERTLANEAALTASDQVDAIDSNDEAGISVTVERTVVEAADDNLGDVTALIEAASGTAVPSVANVLANDTIDGETADLETVVVSSAMADPASPLVVSADGSVSVKTGIAAGTYAQSYRICLVANPANCAEASITAIVSAVPLTANDDTASRRTNGRDGEKALLNVLANDRRGDRTVIPSNVRLSTIETDPPQGLQLRENGTVDLAPGSSAGTAALTYELCEILNPENCSRARVTVPVEVPAVVSGAVYRDANGNGMFDPGSDQAFAGYAVDLLRDGATVASVRTGANGRYAFPTVWPGPDHALVFRDLAGAVIGGLANIDVTGGAVMTGEDLATDPTGIVYDALTREPVAGAVVTIAGTAGKPLPPDCFMVPGQQAQTTAADGAYRFDIMPGADPACPSGQAEYAISLTPPHGYRSSALPPLAGPLDITACVFDAVPGGACQPASRVTPPSPGRPGAYVLSVLLQAGDPPLMHNHIPLDPLVAATPPVVTVTADKPDLRHNEKVTITIEIRNRDPLPAGQVHVADIMPSGFAYVEGSATVDGEATEPAVTPSTLDFGSLALAGNSVVTITAELRAGAGAGRRVNRVRVTNAANKPLAADAVTEFEVAAETASDCTVVAGTVFADSNGNGRLDTGEAGLGGVVLVTGEGAPVVTGPQGRYLVACSQLPDEGASSNLVLKLDEQSLPSGFRLASESPRTIPLAAGKAGAVDFAAVKPRVVRLDLKDAAFAGETTELKPEWAAGIGRLVGVLAKQPSTLHIVYMSGVPENLARRRIATVERAVRAQWSRSGHEDGIEITSRIAGN